LAPGDSAHRSEFNTPVLESANFLVVPTLGHFVPGWLLIIPRLHYPCLGALDRSLATELNLVKAESEQLLMSMYSSVIKFEHGPCSTGVAGACVDHAHLHLVPTSVDLRCELSRRFVGRTINDITELANSYREGRSYLFFEDAKGVKTVYDVELLPSQYMRMLLARELK